MPEIRNELHLNGSQPDIEKLINSVVTPNYPMMDFAKILPVPDELASLPAGMSRVKIDCYLTAVKPSAAFSHILSNSTLYCSVSPGVKPLKSCLPMNTTDCSGLSRNITATMTVSTTVSPAAIPIPTSAILPTEKE